MIKGKTDVEMATIRGEMDKLNNSLGWQVIITLLNAKYDYYKEEILTKQGLDLETKYSKHDINREMLKFISELKDMPTAIKELNTQIDDVDYSIGYGEI